MFLLLFAVIVVLVVVVAVRSVTLLLLFLLPLMVMATGCTDTIDEDDMPSAMTKMMDINSVCMTLMGMPMTFMCVRLPLSVRAYV